MGVFSQPFAGYLQVTYFIKEYNRATGLDSLLYGFAGKRKAALADRVLANLFSREFRRGVGKAENGLCRSADIGNLVTGFGCFLKHRPANHTTGFKTALLQVFSISLAM